MYLIEQMKRAKGHNENINLVLKKHENSDLENIDCISKAKAPCQLLSESDHEVGERMISTVKELYPRNRSIMGPDIRDSFAYFCNKHGEFKSLTFKTGDKVFDWEIPEEWIIRDAYLQHESGMKFAEFSNCNLHVMGYSVPISKILSKKELLKKIHINPVLPDAIPYVTSYYRRDWGFCLSKNNAETLPEGQYKAFIDSEHKPGELVVIEALIPGESSAEIFLSSYLCHPSMANNELSGPALLDEIMSYVKSLKKRRYSYRFVLLPETIGSIAYLSKRLSELKTNMICGFNLSCVGDERAFTHLKSRHGNNMADLALHASLIGQSNVVESSFLDRGSDERQYCSPGVDLPLCTFCRTKFGAYPEYHTSKDDLNVVTAMGLLGSFKIMRSIADSFELGIYPKTNVFGEPQLGKRGLYPNTSASCYGEVNPAKTRMNILAYCDGHTSIFEICKITNLSLEIVLDEIAILTRHNLIETHSNPILNPLSKESIAS